MLRLLAIQEDAAYWGLTWAEQAAFYDRLSAYHRRRAQYHRDRAEYYGRRARKYSRVAAIAGGIAGALIGWQVADWF